jgi:outer membrane translocation and assembly module TamA
VFADAGTVWDEGRAFDSQNVIAGWGFGLRLLVPIVGQVRLDVAWGGSGSGGMFHIGAYEKATMSRKRVR